MKQNMVGNPITLREDYWETFEVQTEDLEFLYNHLLEKETPLTSQELIGALVEERARREKLLIEQKRSAGGVIYFPKGHYVAGQYLVFPAFNWRRGKVEAVRPGNNPDLGVFDVLRVSFDGGETKEMAAGLENHVLNAPPVSEEDAALDPKKVLVDYGDELVAVLEEALASNVDFVRIAGKWFARALLVDINMGHLNLAEAVLDMAGGGPLPTTVLLEQLGFASQDDLKLTEFSLNLALQEDSRFDEVGPAGEVLWFLHRLEPESVLRYPLPLRYVEVEYDRSALTDEMLALERRLDDELSLLSGKFSHLNEVQITLNYPHWRAGTLPLSARVSHLFPTAYEAPRIRFTLVDADSGEKFSGWVVRPHRYVYGLGDWFKSKNVMPGSVFSVKRGKVPGEVAVHCETRRASREWIRTVLVGSDGGVVFALLKQNVTTTVDDRMTIAIPDAEALDQVWQQVSKDRVPFERTVVNVVRELTKLNPQSHVHASELYAAVNTIRRCPPGPILALLSSRPWFVHVGDLHFRFDDSERN